MESILEDQRKKFQEFLQEQVATRGDILLDGQTASAIYYTFGILLFQVNSALKSLLSTTKCSCTVEKKIINQIRQGALNIIFLAHKIVDSLLAEVSHDEAITHFCLVVRDLCQQGRFLTDWHQKFFKFQSISILAVCCDI